MVGKYSKANLSLALKIDYFFHVMFCAYNKEIIPLMENRLELILKQFILHFAITLYNYTAIMIPEHPLKISNNE